MGSATDKPRYYSRKTTARDRINADYRFIHEKRLENFANRFICSSPSKEDRRKVQ